MNIFNKDGEITDSVADVLYELGNVGIGTATKEIGNLRKMQIKIGKPNIVAYSPDLLKIIECKPDEIVVGVSTKIGSSLGVSLLFLLGKEFVQNTVERMTGEMFTEEEILKNELSLSAVTEMMNYMSSGYAKVIGSYLNVPVFLSPFNIGIEKTETMIHDVLCETSENIQKIVCVNTQFTLMENDGHKTNETGKVLIFPDEKSIHKFADIMKR